MTGAYTTDQEVESVKENSVSELGVQFDETVPIGLAILLIHPDLDRKVTAKMAIA